jgi:hypothetical protein
MTPADDVTSAVYAEQVGAVFRQLPIAIAVNLVNDRCGARADGGATVSIAVACVGNTSNGRAVDPMAAIPPSCYSTRKHTPLVGARDGWIPAHRSLLGRRRGRSVPDRAGFGQDLSNDRAGRYVRRNRGA